MLDRYQKIKKKPSTLNDLGGKTKNIFNQILLYLWENFWLYVHTCGVIKNLFSGISDMA